MEFCGALWFSSDQALLCHSERAEDGVLMFQEVCQSFLLFLSLPSESIMPFLPLLLHLYIHPGPTQEL